MSFFPSLSGCFCNCCSTTVIDSSNSNDNYEAIRIVRNLQASNEEMQTLISSDQPKNKQQIEQHSEYVLTIVASTAETPEAEAATAAEAAMEEEAAAQEAAAKEEAAAQETAVEEEAVAQETAAEAAVTVPATRVQLPKARSVDAHCLVQFVKGILEQTSIILTICIPGSGSHERKITLSLAQAMNEDLSQLSLYMSKALYKAITNHQEFPTLGYEIKLMVLGDDNVSRATEDSHVPNIQKDDFRRAYLAFFPRSGEQQSYILDLCSNDFLKHNEIVFGTWKEVDTLVRHHLANSNVPSSRFPTIKEKDCLCKGSFRKGESIFPKNEELAEKLNHYLTGGREDVDELNWQVMLQCYGIPAKETL